MSTKKPVADPDIEPEYDFRDSVLNPYAERYRQDHVPLVTRWVGDRGPQRGPRAMLLEYGRIRRAARA